jgi:hypothetical protein
MHKNWIWLMLMLVPLRLWAGMLMTTAMPEPAHAVHHAMDADPPAPPDHPHHQAQLLAQDPPKALGSQPTHASAHDCGNADDLHTAQRGPNEGQPAAANDACHESPGCTVCAVCHLSAGLLHKVSCPSSRAVYALPTSAPFSGPGRVWPPLLTPPIA